MSKGIGVYGINSVFSSGNLIFYEKTVGRTATGDVFTVGTAAVKVGGTSQDVDFQVYGTGSLSAIIDIGAATFTLAGISITMGDATNIAFNATTGTKIGTATTQKIGFWNVTPVIQPTAYTQTYSTADKTHANPTATAHTYPGSGNMFDAVAADLLINLRTDTVANAVADIVIVEKSLAANLNQDIADLADLKQLVNSIVDDLQAVGILS